MRNILLFCFVAFMSMTSRAQDPRRHRDTLNFGSGGLPELMKAPVLTGQSQPIVITPVRTPLCFTKEIDMQMRIGGRVLEQTIYLNTEKGLTGILPPLPGGPVRDIMPEIETFNFSVLSMKGNIYVYKNHKTKDGIAHEVSTGNTQSFLYQSPVQQGSGAASAMARKSDNRSYCGGKLTAQAYKYDGGMSTWYLYGDRFPAELHPVKYMGAFGLGYLFCQEGLYLICELNFSNNFVKIGDIYNMPACFDPSAFVVLEDKFAANAQQDIAKARANADEELAKVSGDCAAEKTAVINFKKALADKQEQLMRKAQSGNMYNDTAAQHAMLRMSDPIDNCQMSILMKTQAICMEQAALSKNPRDPASIQAKIQCNQQLISLLQEAISRMQAIDAQNATHPEIAGPQKSKVYLQVMSGAPNCN